MLSTRSRNQRGGVIVEGAVGICLFFFFAMPVMIFLCNVSCQLICQAQIAHIANQSAQVINDQKYWLGLPRPGYDNDTGKTDAENAAKKMCEKVGFKDASA